MDVTSNAIKATLLVGDSFPARLDKERLGKKKKVVINMAKGGSRIPDVVHTVKEFRNNPENSKYAIDQVFISVGTNDIRRCYSGGVYHFSVSFVQLRTFFLILKSICNHYCHYQ